MTYYDQASKGLEAQLSDLSKARKFIFMEYHAIEDKERAPYPEGAHGARAGRSRGKGVL